MKNILLEQRGPILKIILNRPKVHNAFDSKTIAEITSAFKSAPKNKKTRVILLSGSGSSFCAGGDLKWMKASIKYSKAANLKDAELLFDMFDSVENCPLPVVALVHGGVYGGGTGLIAACDIVVADTSTKFCFSEVKLGLAPATISSFVLRKMTTGKAREYMLTGRVFDAEEAHVAGLVQYVGRELESQAHADEIIKSILKAGPEAVATTKKIIGDLSTMQKSKIKAYSCQMIASRRVSKEGQEGMSAFLSKRKPKWYVTDDK